MYEPFGYQTKAKASSISSNDLLVPEIELECNESERNIELLNNIYGNSYDFKFVS